MVVKEKIKDIYKSLKSTDTLFFLVLWMLILTHGTVLLIINVFFGIGDNELFWFGIQQVLWGGYFFLRMSYRHIKLIKTKGESSGNN